MNKFIKIVMTLIFGMCIYSTSVFASSGAITVPFSKYTMTTDETKNWTADVNLPKVKSNVDVLFVMDTTGSMNSYSSWVSNAMVSMQSQLNKLGANSIHWGEYSFGDQDADSPFGHTDIVMADYTDTEFANKMSTLSRFDGGDFPEDDILATLQGGQESAWRSDSTKFIILLTDESTKTRPDQAISGYSVTPKGLQSYLNSAGIEMSIQKIGESDSTGAGIIKESDLATQTGALYYQSSDEESLLKNMELSIDNSSNDEHHHYSSKITYRYESDGVPSNDISVSITPSYFDLNSGESKKFNISAHSVSNPKRYNDRTIATIEYFEDGIVIPSATQELYLSVDKKCNVIARYVDESGHNISGDVVKSGNVGDAYTTEQKNIDGYTFKKVQGNATGKFTDENQTVTYIYAQNTIPDPVVPNNDDQTDNKNSSSNKPVQNKKHTKKSADAILPKTNAEKAGALFGYIFVSAALIGLSVFDYKRRNQLKNKDN